MIVEFSGSKDGVGNPFLALLEKFPAAESYQFIVDCGDCKELADTGVQVAQLLKEGRVAAALNLLKQQGYEYSHNKEGVSTPIFIGPSRIGVPKG